MQSISQFFNKDIDPWYNEGHKKGHIAGHEEGRQEGHQEGRQEAVSERNQQFTITLLQSTDFDDEKIASLVGVSIVYVAEIRASLKK